MDTVVHKSINEIDAKQWNQLLISNNPFMRYEFLHGLELCQCVSPLSGWEPQHIALYDGSARQQLLGVMPCYIKSHSYGEYIFDWSWADAYQRNGLDYYPKLSNAVPFTPATGERWLLKNKNDLGVPQRLIDEAINLANKLELSSFHSLFLTHQASQNLSDDLFLKRHSTQFHWQNKDYSSFDDFLSLMSSKKRKNIKRERRRVKETGITYKWLSGSDLSSEAAVKMHHFYSRTISFYGAQAYLNLAFFKYIAKSFAQHTLFLFAYFEGQIIAGGLYFKSNNTLYGRYWGALDNFHSVHFETCYYQAIEWCIQNNYQYFEAGAQGEHKQARGLEPTTTYSAHWIKQPDFRDAIRQFIDQESEHIERYQENIQEHSPFKLKSES